MKNIDHKLKNVKEIIKKMERVIISYSGGIDSTLLAKIAYDELGENVIAVTCKSPSMPFEEIEEAINFSKIIGIKHKIINTDEFNDKNYLKNDNRRCYHCKNHMGKALFEYAWQYDYKFVLDGSNIDDSKDYRPGSWAAKELGMKSPLKEAGITKAEIRKISKAYGLPNWNKPAMPCLSSRIPYNTPIDIDKLNQVNEAEKIIKSLGISSVRVRHHGVVARIQVLPQKFELIIKHRNIIHYGFAKLGFIYITLDLLGSISGNLNKEIKNEYRKVS